MVSDDKMIELELIADDDSLIGSVFAEKYKLEALLGDGMGVVYRAEDVFLHRQVVVKILIPGLGFDRNALLRFRQEGAVLSRLQHPNIVSVYEYDVAEGKPYLAMQYIDGTTVDALIQSQGQVSIESVVELLLQASDALAYAHEQTVIHRDLKPSNMIVETQTGTLKILDFGIAKILSESDSPKVTKTGEVFGSPPYMSPEQAKGLPVDIRSDVYSLGCVAFEMLTGKTPHQGTDALDILVRLQTESIPSLKDAAGKPFPEDLERIVARMVAKDPQERFSSMTELREALVRFKERQPIFLKELKSETAKRRSRILDFTAKLAASLLLIGVAYAGFVGAETYQQLRIPSGRLESIQPTSCVWEQSNLELARFFPEDKLKKHVANFEADREYLRKLSAVNRSSLPDLKKHSQRLVQEIDWIFPIPYTEVSVFNAHNLPEGDNASISDRVQELGSLSERAMTRAKHLVGSAEIAGILSSVEGFSKYILCDFPAAQTAYEQSVSSLQKTAPESTVYARASSGLGDSFYFQHKYKEAIPAYEHAIAAWNKSEDADESVGNALPRIYGLSLSRLADCYRVEKRFKESRKFYGLACDFWKRTEGDQSKPVALCWLYLAYLDSLEPPEKDDGNFIPNNEPAGFEYRRTSADVRGEFGKLKRAELLTRWSFAGTNYLGFLLEDIYQIRYSAINPLMVPTEFMERLEAKRISKSPEYISNGAVVAKDIRPFTMTPNRGVNELPGAVREEP